MESRIEVVRYPDGDIQRFQVVSDFAWKGIKFVHAPFSGSYVGRLAQLYRTSILPRSTHEWGRLRFFHVPPGLDVSSMPRTIGGVTYYDPSANMAAWLISGDPAGEELFAKLEKLGYADTVEGQGSGVKYMPVSGYLGLVSDMKRHRLASNAHFFLLEPEEVASPWDLLGTPFGMAIESGKMVLPPLFHRPALVVDKDGSHIAHPELKDVAMVIDGVTYRHGKNCTIYERPETEVTPLLKGMSLIIAGDRVVASKQGGRVRVPMGGFVMQLPESIAIMNPLVGFRSKVPYQFAIQGGPVMAENGTMATGLDGCPFAAQGGVQFPPTTYPRAWNEARAGRMVLGSDSAGNPVLVWAESASAEGYEKGKQSPGCTLGEMASYCGKIGLVNAVNLDGGGSAQLCYNGIRLLHLKDRNEEHREAERPVPGIFTID